MTRIAIGVPVMYNFEGYAKLMRSIQGTQIIPYIQDNWNDNIGVAPSWNLFLQQGRNEDVDILFIVNDDVIFEAGSFWTAVDAWEKRPKDCILLTAHCSKSNEYQYYPDMADFACFMMNPAEALQKIGPFDDKFRPAYFEDDDYMYRIKLADYKTYIYSQFKIQHVGSKTQFWHGEENRVVSHEQFRANRAYYKRKWGGEPGYEKYKLPFNESKYEQD